MCSVYNKQSNKKWKILEYHWNKLLIFAKRGVIDGCFRKRSFEKFVENLKHIFVVEEFSFHQITFI